MYNMISLANHPPDNLVALHAILLKGKKTTDALILGEKVAVTTEPAVYGRYDIVKDLNEKYNNKFIICHDFFIEPLNCVEEIGMDDFWILSRNMKTVYKFKL